MPNLITNLCFIWLAISISACGTTQKIRLQDLERRMRTVELENSRLLKENTAIKAQVQLLLNNLDKPAAGGQPSNQIGIAAAVLSFDKTIHNFGTIQSGKAVTHTFRFKNTGQSPLIIKNAKASCGCTVPKWPKEPIHPGGEGAIDVTFNSKGKSGNQHKSVTITANTDPAEIRLYIKAQISD